MRLERFLKQLSQRTGLSPDKLQEVIDQQIDNGATKGQIYNRFVKRTGDNNHATAPHYVRRQRQTPDHLMGD